MPLLRPETVSAATVSPTEKKRAMRRAGCLLLAVWCLPLLGETREAAAGDKPAAAEASADKAAHPVLDLFDGKSLAGWTVENGAEAAVTDDGLLKLVAGDGWLRSDHTYTDFKLHIEWMALGEEGYDAGIYVRTRPGGKPFPKDSWQINLLKGKEGWLSRLKAEHQVPVHPAGEWNTFDITVRGETVSLEVNGQKAYSVSGLTTAAGHVGLQCEVPLGGQFVFRNIQLTELSHQPLFDGGDLGHWEGAGSPAEKCWKVAEGELIGLKQKGPWLRTKQQYGDFNLRLDYQVEPGANSGVYVRVPADGNHHRDSTAQAEAGFEIQILDDSAKRYANLKDYQYCGGLYDIAGPKHRVCRTPGEWNTMEIDCRGQRVRVRHNGLVIIDATTEAFPLLALRKTEGFLGLQNHGGGVRFRNVRIGDSFE